MPCIGSLNGNDGGKKSGGDESVSRPRLFPARGMNGSTPAPIGGANRSNDIAAVVGGGESECVVSGDVWLDGSYLGDTEG